MSSRPFDASFVTSAVLAAGAAHKECVGGEAAGHLGGGPENGILSAKGEFRYCILKPAEPCTKRLGEEKEVPLIINSQFCLTKETASLGRAKQSRTCIHSSAADDQSGYQVVRIVLDQCERAAPFQHATHFPNKCAASLRRDVVEYASRHHEIKFPLVKRNPARIGLKTLFDSPGNEIAGLEHARRGVASRDAGEFSPK